MAPMVEREAGPSTRRVVIVDDNAQLAENIAEILEMEGFETDVSNNAEDALPKALEPGIEALVTDFRLPGMSGVDLVNKIRLQGGRVRAIVISAYTDDLTIAAARASGAEFLAKPLDLAQLSQYLSRGVAA